MHANDPPPAPAAAAERERCARIVEAVMVGDTDDLAVSAITTCMRCPVNNTVDAERARCAEIIRGVFIGIEADDAPLRGALAAIESGEPAE